MGLLVTISKMTPTGGIKRKGLQGGALGPTREERRQVLEADVKEAIEADETHKHTGVHTHTHVEPWGTPGKACPFFLRDISRPLELASFPEGSPHHTLPQGLLLCSSWP